MSAAIAAVLTEVLLHGAPFPLLGVPCRKNVFTIMKSKEHFESVEAATLKGCSQSSEDAVCSVPPLLRCLGSKNLVSDDAYVILLCSE